ncbi:MAG TPA: glycosyltransferase family 9 protein [Pseudonocardiaceae bacterium]|nr:glycosyltransferase family 9 protein [Pseudonocardiaceae bacterium]
MNRREILVLRALGLGDLLTAIPALRALRRAEPDARITLAAPNWLTQLADEIDAVDRLLPTPGLTRLEWSGAPPELSVNLHGRGPQSIDLLTELRPSELFSHASRHHPRVRGPQWQEEQHEVRRWCRMLEHFGIATDPDDLNLPKPMRGGPAPGAVVVHPGASHRARCWPAQRYGEVASRLAEAGAHVVVTGSASERELASVVARVAGLPEHHVLTGNTGLSSLAALIAHARMVVCGDTGVAHLATAYGTPSVVLFGPVSPAHWGPPPDRRQHQVLWAGSIGDTFADRPDPGLLQITADQVIGAVESYWSSGGESRSVKGGAACARIGSAS